MPDPANDVNPRIVGPNSQDPVPCSQFESTSCSLASTMSFASTMRGSQSGGGISMADSQRRLLKKSDSVFAMTYEEGQVIACMQALRRNFFIYSLEIDSI